MVPGFMEELVENFSSSNSTLIKSFWAGKLIQKLQDDDHQTSSLQGEQPAVLTSSNPPCPPCSHVDNQESPYQQLILESLHCLKKLETSLSPRVHDIIADGVEAPSSSVEKEIIQPNGTLNWNVVSRYINEGIINVIITCLL